MALTGLTKGCSGPLHSRHRFQKGNWGTQPWRSTTEVTTQRNLCENQYQEAKQPWTAI